MVGNVFHNFRNRKGTGKYEKIIKEIEERKYYKICLIFPKKCKHRVLLLTVYAFAYHVNINSLSNKYIFPVLLLH